MAPYRLQGWDPILIISQIVCLQSLHYLTLSCLVPPLLSLLTNPRALDYQGGAANVGMVMDWREMAGRPTITGLADDVSRGWKGFQKGAWSGGKWFSQGGDPSGPMWTWDGGADSSRGWVIALAWLVVSGADAFYVYHLIRKPTHVLDFSLTLLFNHLILTTYYASSLPSSLFFWLIVLAGSGITVVFAEHFCVQREMREGLGTIGAVQEERARDRLLEPAEEGWAMGEHIEMNGMAQAGPSGSRS